MPGPSEIARLEEEAAEAVDQTPEPALPLHLAPPVLLGDINMRLTLRPADGTESVTALAMTFDSDTLALLNAKLAAGTVDLDITNGFGKQRSIKLSPAELIFFSNMAEKFVRELPR